MAVKLNEGDSATVSDQLVIKGDSLLGPTPTMLHVTNAAGLGAPTVGNGILLVSVLGASSPGAFVLDGDTIRAGAYVYSLVQVGKDWYLQSVAARVAVAKSAEQRAAIPGGRMTYAITVSNPGRVDVHQVVVTDSPDSTIFSDIRWVCSAQNGAICPAESGTGDLNQTLPTLPAGGVLNYSLSAQVSVSPPAQVSNTLSVNPADAICDSGQTRPCEQTAVVPSVASVSVSKSSSTVSPVRPGATVAYVVTVANAGSVSATNIAVNDPIPAGITSGGWTCVGYCGAASGALPLSDVIASLPVGASSVYRITAVTVDSHLPASITNIAYAVPGDNGVCAGGTAPPCRSTPVNLMTQKEDPASIPALSRFALLLLALSLGVLAMNRKKLL